MRKELDEMLCEKYPLIFAQRNGDKRETCMVWGFECGDGWYNILDTLCANIQHRIDCKLETIELAHKLNEELKEAESNAFEGWPDWKMRNPRKIPEPIEQVVAIQVKEKFGTLRFYFMGGDDVIDGMVSMAESMSARMCEICGVPTTRDQEDGWVRTRCDEHKNA